MSYVLQYLVGFQSLGHQVTFVEQAGYPRSCFDPRQKIMTDDCSHGLAAVHDLLSRFGLGDKWCFVDNDRVYHGLTREEVEQEFRQADIFVDMGTHGSWREEADAAGLRILVDGEPAYNQIRMQQASARYKSGSEYDYYFTNGMNVGTAFSTAPTAGKEWRHIFHPVAVDSFEATEPPDGAPFTTLMNWQSHEPIEWEGVTYGQKDVEFEKFIDLPTYSDVGLELAISGNKVPERTLRASGWRLRDGHDVAASYDSFRSYIQGSTGEFSVCKNVFVAMNTGWFSDRSAAYLAAGRPVVMQETGFSSHLPVGDGLFAVQTVDEAASAIDQIRSRYRHHSSAAHALAAEYLDVRPVLKTFMEEIGIE